MVDLRTQGSSARRNGSTCLALRCSPRGDLALLGDHNVANALAAALAVATADASHQGDDARARS